MPDPVVRSIDLFPHKQFSRKQIELLDWYQVQRAKRLLGVKHEHIVVPVWGRRCGKSDGSSALFAEILVDELCDTADQIRRGEVAPWRGLGKTRLMQRRARPHKLAFVVAPEGRDLVDVAGHLLNIFSGPAEVFLHPDPRMQLLDNGSKILFVHEKAALQVWLIPAKHAASMVGRGPCAVLMTEAGFIPSHHWDRLVPALWDSSAWVIAEGTPTQDDSHWLTRLAVSGLPDGHPEADRQISPRDDRVHTSRANTIDHAYLPQARERARFEAKFRGDRWAKLWVYASWEIPADVVFDEFDAIASVVDFQPWPIPSVTFADGVRKDLPSPDRIDADVDWHRGSAPGATTVTYVWHRNPLSVDGDPRPLFLVAAEHQDDDPPEQQGGQRRLPYSSDGWWRILRELRDSWGIRKWYADPSAPDLAKAARRAHIPIKPADAGDKSSRISLLNAQCHTIPGGRPALLVSRSCPKVAKCLGTLQWQRTRTGDLTGKPSGYNDHLADCLCYTAGRYAKPASMVPINLT